MLSMAENRALEFIVTILTSVDSFESGKTRAAAVGPRGRSNLKSACLTVERAAAGRSPEDLNDALHELYAALGAAGC